MYKRCININSQLDATITKFIANYNQLNMFRAIISPILRTTRLCLQLVILCTGDVACWQSNGPEVGRNYRPKHVELIVISNKFCYCCIWLAVYIIVSMMHGHTHI